MASAGTCEVSVSSGRPGLRIKDCRDEFRLDELLLAACSFAEGERGEAVELAVCAGGVLVQECDGGGGEELLGAAGEAPAGSQRIQTTQTS